MEIEYSVQSNMRRLNIPYVFVGNMILYSLIGYYIDKKFDIGNYIVLFILFGIFMGFYSAYRIYMRLEDEEAEFGE